MNKIDPRVFIFMAAGLALLLSVYFFFFTVGPQHMLYGIYVGLWVPSILSGFNLYYKRNWSNDDER